jgi:hypothetical protein
MKKGMSTDRSGQQREPVAEKADLESASKKRTEIAQMIKSRYARSNSRP